jgi:CRISPR/Cas system CSM-associated protein Csm3 (group 7 of RAMP superfamily)
MANPYHFIPFSNQPVQRNRTYSGHDQIKINSGSINCYLATLTPFIIRSIKWNPGAENNIVIPGTSIRGMLRAFCDIVGEGCGSFIGETPDTKEVTKINNKLSALGKKLLDTYSGLMYNIYKKNPQNEFVVVGVDYDNDPVLNDSLVTCESKIHDDLKNLSDEDEIKAMISKRFDVCPICRMFGFTANQTGMRSKVIIYDTDPLENEGIAIRNVQVPTNNQLGRPKPHHGAFYFKSKSFKKFPDAEITGLNADKAFVIKGGALAGRKRYLHGKWIANKGTTFQPISAIDAGAIFKFKISFTNLSDDELNMLLFAITLKDGWAHKLGFGKALGLGSVRLSIHNLFIVNQQQLFTDFQQTQSDPTNHLPYINDFLQKIERLNYYPALDKWMRFSDQALRYPSYQEFRDNPEMTLDQFNQGELDKSKDENDNKKSSLVKQSSETKKVIVKRIDSKGRVYIELEGQEMRAENPLFNIKQGVEVTIRVDTDKTGHKKIILKK